MEETKKTAAELLQEKLLMKPENSYSTMSDDLIKASDDFAVGYKNYLDAGKTEREAVVESINLAKAHGYVEYDSKKKYLPGERVYLNNRSKAVIFATIGTEPMEKGVRIVASHIDSPRIDLKPRPLYEEAQLAYFKTHYYGGIKKYQWATVPLALHGTIVKKDGTSIKVNIGEDEADPVFCVTDLLIHLAKDQMERKLSQGIKGDELNILIGSRQFKDDKASEKVKIYIANLLFEKYGITEQDLLSAELCAVPACKARDVGLDRSMIGAYGHDDRVCAYTSLMAEFESAAPQYTHITVLADKEETGSSGNTGLNSSFLRYFVADLCAPYGLEARHVLSNSLCLSADVNCAFDPTFPDVSERRNTAYFNYGVVVTKYTGSGGKSSTNDASAEFMAFVRKMLDDNGIIWQTGELGKVDQGGGGTVAKYVSALNVETVDIGIPVLSMHAPFEIVAKNDVYCGYLAFKAFMA